MTAHVPDDVTAIAADDLLIATLASGEPVADLLVVNGDLAELFGAWRSELDAAAEAAGPAPLPVDVVDGASWGVAEDDSPTLPLPAPVGRTSRRDRWRRHLAGGAAVVVTLAASTGVAAAAGGSHGPLAPLHRLLFGTSQSDERLAEATHLLDRVAAGIASARAAGGISDGGRAALGRSLDHAAALVVVDSSAASRLGSRVAALRAALAALPALTGVPGSADSSGPGGPAGTTDDPGGDRHGGRGGSDDNGGSGHGGSGSDDSHSGSSSGGSGSGGSGSDDNGSRGSGSDDSGSGSDDSGSGSGDRSGSGSGDSHEGGSGGGSGGGSDDGSQSGGGTDSGSRGGGTDSGGSGGSGGTDDSGSGGGTDDSGSGGADDGAAPGSGGLSGSGD